MGERDQWVREGERHGREGGTGKHARPAWERERDWQVCVVMLVAQLKAASQLRSVMNKHVGKAAAQEQ